MSHSKATAILFTVASVSLFAACASSPPPKARMASTQASVSAARDLGAEGVPNAEIELKRADDQINHARALSKKGDNDSADMMLQRASADADLASAYVKENEARTKAQAALERAGMSTPGAYENPSSPGPVYLSPEGK
jgi:hypothetical protein